MTRKSDFVEALKMRGKKRTIGFTMREIDVVFDPERKLFLYLGVTLLAVGVGPFGTYEAMAFWERTVFWTLDVFAGMGIIAAILHVFFHSRLTAFLPSYPRFFLGVALGALPATAFVSVLYGMVGDSLEISTPFPQLYVEITIFSSILLLAEFLFWPAVFGVPAQPDPTRESPVPAEGNSPLSLPAAALLSRLPEEHRNSEIVSISMQDHYAEVTTTSGQALILLRLSDAIDLLEGYPGARIHRSHWVAKKFFKETVRNGRRLEAVLSDDRRLPVGNTYVEVVRDQLANS